MEQRYHSSWQPEHAELHSLVEVVERIDGDCCRASAVQRDCDGIDGIERPVRHQSDFSDERLTFAAGEGLECSIGDRHIARVCVTDYIRAAGPIYCDAVSDIVIASAEISGVKKLGAVGGDSGNKG